MQIQDILLKITDLAVSHRNQEDDEISYIYEIEGYELILGYLIHASIVLGEHDLKGLYESNEAYEENRYDPLTDIQLEVLSENPPFQVHPDALKLYQHHAQAFWPEIE